jgi:hypothetical protein
MDRHANREIARVDRAQNPEEHFKVERLIVNRGAARGHGGSDPIGGPAEINGVRTLTTHQAYRRQVRRA